MLFPEHYSHSHETRSTKGVEERIDKISRIIQGSKTAVNSDGQSAASSMASKRFSVRAKQKEEAVVRLQLESLKVYTPWFIYLITMLQLLATSAVLLLGGITEIGLVPTKCVSRKLDCKICSLFDKNQAFCAHINIGS